MENNPQDINTQVPNTIPTSKTDSPNRKKTVILVIIVLLFFLFICGITIGVVLLNRNKEESSDEVTTETTTTTEATTTTETTTTTTTEKPQDPDPEPVENSTILDDCSVKLANDTYPGWNLEVTDPNKTLKLTNDDWTVTISCFAAMFDSVTNVCKDEEKSITIDGQKFSRAVFYNPFPESWTPITNSDIVESVQIIETTDELCGDICMTPSSINFKGNVIFIVYRYDLFEGITYGEAKSTINEIDNIVKELKAI